MLDTSEVCELVHLDGAGAEASSGAFPSDHLLHLDVLRPHPADISEIGVNVDFTERVVNGARCSEQQIRRVVGREDAGRRNVEAWSEGVKVHDGDVAARLGGALG